MLIQISATHIESGKVLNKRVDCENVSNLIKILAKHGWIVNRLVTIT